MEKWPRALWNVRASAGDEARERYAPQIILLYNYDCSWMPQDVGCLNHDDVIARITQWGEERSCAALKPARVSRRVTHEQSTVIPQHI